MHGLQWDYSFPRSPHGDFGEQTVQYDLTNIQNIAAILDAHLDTLTTESVTLRKAAVSSMCLAVTKIRLSSSTLVSNLRSYSMSFM
jgi:hypothetical protein